MSTTPHRSAEPRQGRQGKPRRRASRLRERDLLRNPLPVALAVIAAFAVVLTLMTARLVLGADPALRRAAAASPAIVAHASHASHAGTRTVVRTTASGRRIVTTVPAGEAGAAASTRAGEGAPQIVTRISGSTGGGVRTHSSGSEREGADD